MKQKEFWNSKWTKVAYEQLPVTSFAKSSVDFIADKNIKTLLDIGCGDGNDSIYFAQQGINVTAVDFSDVAINLLENKIDSKSVNNISTKTLDIRNMDFPQESFDVIYANVSLHYFTHQDTSKIFDNIYKFLKTGGYFFVRCKSSKNKPKWSNTLIEDGLYISKDKQYRLFTEEYMRDAMIRFQLQEVKHVSEQYNTMDYGIQNTFFIEVIGIKK